MAWYQLTTDVMVQGTPRSFGEVLDLSASDGQLLVGLGRAKSCDAPTLAEPEPARPVCPMPAVPAEAKPATPAEAKPVEAKEQVKPVVRRRAPSPTPED
jgi:hypothetical protein